MKTILIAAVLLLAYTASYSQKKVTDYYSMMTYKSLNAGISEDFIKTESGIVIKTYGFKYNKKKARVDGLRIDSLNIIDFISDTVFVLSHYDAVRPFEPMTYVKSGADFVLIGYGSLKKLDGKEWPFYYDYFHPILLNVIFDWDKEGLIEVINNFSSSSSHPEWIDVIRVIIEGGKVISRDYRSFDTVIFMSLRRRGIPIDF